MKWWFKRKTARVHLTTLNVWAAAGLALCLPREAAADSIWQKALHGPVDEEGAVQSAIERVLLGYGDERDLLTVRVALITLSRGEISDPRSIVLLVRLRREMGLMPATVSDSLLSEALRGDLSLTEQSWAFFEKAHLKLRRRDLEGASKELERALPLAWRASQRAEVLILRGFVSLRGGQDDAALATFDEVAALPVPPRLKVEAHIGRALAFVERGDAYRAEAEARLAFLVEAGRATVSRLDPFWDLALTSQEQRAARALLLFGKAAHLQGSNSEAARVARQNACLFLRPTSQTVDSAGAFEPVDEAQTKMAPWGTSSLAGLRGLFEETCALSLVSNEAVEEAGAETED